MLYLPGHPAICEAVLVFHYRKKKCSEVKNERQTELEERLQQLENTVSKIM